MVKRYALLDDAEIVEAERGGLVAWLDYAALEARCREQQEQFDALYSRNVFIEASLASNKTRIAELEAALRWSRDGFVIHCPKATAYISRIDSALETAVKHTTQDGGCLNNSQHEWIPLDRAGQFKGRQCPKCGAGDDGYGLKVEGTPKQDSLGEIESGSL